MIRIVAHEDKSVSYQPFDDARPKVSVALGCLVSGVETRSEMKSMQPVGVDIRALIAIELRKNLEDRPAPLSIRLVRTLRFRGAFTEEACKLDFHSSRDSPS